MSKNMVCQAARTSKPKTRIDWGAWERFLQDLDAAELELAFEPYEERFYRGHAMVSWALDPTLFREYPNVAIEEVESDLFFEFQARASELHHLSLTSWDILFFMRHHGVPTRLLDWTEVLGVALYFALERQIAGIAKEEERPCIWVLNPFVLNGCFYSGRERADLFVPEKLDDEDGNAYLDYGDLLMKKNWPSWWEKPLAIYPQQKPQRMGAQRGWFTAHGSDPRPLDVQCPKQVRRVEIPGKAIPAALEILRIGGIDPYGIYADLDGLAASLSHKNAVRRSAIAPLPRPASKGRASRRSREIPKVFTAREVHLVPKERIDSSGSCRRI